HKHSVDTQISVLQGRVAGAQQRAERLVSEIDSVNARIHGLEARVGDVNSRLAALESDLALHRLKLDRLTELFRIQTRRYSPPWGRRSRPPRQRRRTARRARRHRRAGSSGPSTARS